MSRPALTIRLDFSFSMLDLVAVVLTVTYLGAVLDHIGAGVFLGALSAYG